MHLPPESSARRASRRLVCASVITACLAGAWVPPFASAQAIEAPVRQAGNTERAAPTGIAVQKALADLRQDPNLGHTKRVRTLRWLRQDQPPPPQERPWLFGLFEFLGRAGGVALWGLGAVAVALVIIWLLRVLRLHAPPAVPTAAELAPQRILDLDIRPASLPADIGTAAQALLREGRIREALSLLYRGALSRAVHGFGLAIAASFTEGEVLAAVRKALDAPRTGFFEELVALWRRTVYAGDAPSPETVAPLCTRFNDLLGNIAR
ncbi:MAG: DUF4129 domain-containing protein [Steroidobacteraceae bacterium]